MGLGEDVVYRAVERGQLSKVKFITVLDEEGSFQRIKGLTRSLISLIVDHVKTGASGVGEPKTDVTAEFL